MLRHSPWAASHCFCGGRVRTETRVAWHCRRVADGGSGSSFGSGRRRPGRWPGHCPCAPPQRRGVPWPCRLGARSTHCRPSSASTPAVSLPRRSSLGGGGGGHCWAPLTRKRHIPPHSAQPRHTNYWAPRTRKRHQQEHRPQRPTQRSDPTQHVKGRTGERPGPRKAATTRRNVTGGGGHP